MIKYAKLDPEFVRQELQPKYAAMLERNRVKNRILMRTETHRQAARVLQRCRYAAMTLEEKNKLSASRKEYHSRVEVKKYRSEYARLRRLRREVRCRHLEDSRKYYRKHRQEIVDGVREHRCTFAARAYQRRYQYQRAGGPASREAELLSLLGAEAVRAG